MLLFMPRHLRVLVLGLLVPACGPIVLAPMDGPSPEEPDEAALEDPLSQLERMCEADPRQGPARYVLARVHASQGDRALALARLHELLAIEAWDYALAPEDFAPLVDDPEFTALAEQALARVPAVEHGPVAFELDALDILPEGVAWDPKRQELLVGSMAKRQVLAAGADGRTRVVVAPGQDGLPGVLGITVDAARDRLFVAAVAMPMMNGYDAEADAGQAAVYGFSLEDGTTVGRWPAPSNPSQLNDLVVLTDGTVFVTDSTTGAVLRKDPEAPSGTPLELLVPEETFFAPNGIAELADEQAIVVADFAGLHRVELDGGSIASLMPPPGVLTLSGIDGLERRGSTLVGIQNLVGHGRVWALELDADGRQLVSARVLDTDHPLYRGPTTGTVAGDRFLYLANAALQMGPDGLVPPPEGRAHVILELGLGPEPEPEPQREPEPVPEPQREPEPEPNQIRVQPPTLSGNR